MIRSFFAVNFILFNSFLVFSQDPQIVFDRPGIADSPYIVDTNNWLVETGVTGTKDSKIQDVILPTILLRKYIGFKTEARLSYNYSPQMQQIMDLNDVNNDINIALGFKRKLIYEHGYYPETSVSLNTFYSSKKLFSKQKNSLYNIEAGFQFQSHILDELAINYNVGTIFTDKFKDGVLSYSFCITGLAHKDIELFVEIFGYASKSQRSEMGYDFGVIYYPNQWSQLDLSFIDNIFIANHFLSLQFGYSFCFHN